MLVNWYDACNSGNTFHRETYTGSFSASSIDLRNAIVNVVATQNFDCDSVKSFKLGPGVTFFSTYVRFG